MNLVLKATTNVPDLVIDFIEVKLRSGRTVSLNWDRSNKTCFESENEISIYAEYFYLYFGEEPADVSLDELRDLKVTAVGLYSDTYPVADIRISEMIFEDEEQTLTLENVYSATEVSTDD